MLHAVREKNKKKCKKREKICKKQENAGRNSLYAILQTQMTRMAQIFLDLSASSASSVSEKCDYVRKSTGRLSAVHFTSHVSFVISSSSKLWYTFLADTSSICACRASS